MIFDEAALRALISEEVRKVMREESQRAGSSIDDYLSIPNAAKVADVSADTIRSWIDDGSLRRYGRGRVVRVRRSELDALLASQPSDSEDSEIERAAQAAMRKMR